MLIRLISLFRFHLDCLKVYFRKGVKWDALTLARFLRQCFYYFANETYCWFVYSAEALRFMALGQLKQIDKALNLKYVYPSQFMLALREGLKVEKPETLYRLTYGETTWFGINTALKAVEATSKDVFYDLGCGTGRNVFFANQVFGMQATGIDLLPSFVKYATEVARQYQLNQVHFLEQNIFESDLSQATIVYITANCYDAQTMPLLVERLNALPVEARVISTHRAIPSPRLKVTAYQLVPFSWGVDKLFYHSVVAPA